MQKIFKNIVVPVPFNGQTSQVVSKAIEFANQLQCHLHLIHVIPSGIFPASINLSRDWSDRKYKLREIEKSCYPSLEEGLVVFTGLESGDPERAITEYAIRHHIDTILLNEPSRFHFLRPGINPDRVANKTGCAVLTFRPDTIIHQIKTIILPIGTTLPLNKLRVATYLAKQFSASVHLVATDSGIPDKLSYLKKSFQVLKENTDLDIVCKSLGNENFGNTLLKYANSVDASLIVVNPGPESSLPGFFRRIGSLFSANNSRIPVMTVS